MRRRGEEEKGWEKGSQVLKWPRVIVATFVPRQNRPNKEKQSRHRDFNVRAQWNGVHPERTGSQKGASKPNAGGDDDGDALQAGLRGTNQWISLTTRRGGGDSSRTHSERRITVLGGLCIIRGGGEERTDFQWRIAQRVLKLWSDKR